jgi:CHRD domain-containing protein
VSALLAGRLYFDVNSAAHTDGEIRGQIVAP